MACTKLFLGTNLKQDTHNKINSLTNSLSEDVRVTAGDNYCSDVNSPEE